MISVALVGAGGKMGCRITDNLMKTGYAMRYVETGQRGVANLAARGLSVTPAQDALSDADVMIMAVPDTLIGTVSGASVPQLKSGALVVVLDPAAPLVGKLCMRADLSYVVTHPCHPSLFSDEPDPEIRKDVFGGIRAKQHIVCSLLQGSEQDYERGAALAREMFAPVVNVYRVTLEQMAILEPGLTETVAATLIAVIGEALEESIAAGVPREAATEFLLGHIHIALNIVFKQIDSPFSDGCLKAMERARAIMLQPDWKRALALTNVRKESEAITGHECGLRPQPSGQRSEIRGQRLFGKHDVLPDL
ncbi:MAG: semialdehyde dehydrogenase [Kiritimatiellae bacterium]|nr:semialdehyde dehydrogenase [Kiritimatiellia bacterium]